MVVLIANITDSPESKHKPTELDIHNRTLAPGESVRLPAELVDKRVRKLAEENWIAIGSLPSWYTASKARAGKRLTDEEKKKLIVRTPTTPVAEKAPTADLSTKR